MAAAHQQQSESTNQEAKTSVVAKSNKRSWVAAYEAGGIHSDYQSSDEEQVGLDVQIEGSAASHDEGLQRYYYTERERYLPLANITRSLKDAASHSIPGRNIKVTKAGEVYLICNPMTVSLQYAQIFRSVLPYDTCP